MLEMAETASSGMVQERLSEVSNLKPDPNSGEYAISIKIAVLSGHLSITVLPAMYNTGFVSYLSVGIAEKRGCDL